MDEFLDRTDEPLDMPAEMRLGDGPEDMFDTV